MGLVIIESALTSRAKCSECKRKILKNTPRGVMVGRDEYNREKKWFVCHKCLLEMLDKEIDVLRKRKKELKKLTKRNMKDVILMEIDTNGNV